MDGRHPEDDLIPYLRGELAAADQERVDRHLVACARCRAATESYRVLLDDLARSAPLAPAVHWGRYRAEVRERIERRTRRRTEAWRWWLRPVPTALAAALIGVLVMVAVQGGRHRVLVRPEAVAFEEIMLGRRLGLLERYDILERLDLFEDLDVIQHLDGLSTTSES